MNNVILNYIIKTCSICSHFKHSVVAKQRLHIIQNSMNMDENNLIQSVSTSWNSTLHMIKTMIERTMIERKTLALYASDCSHIEDLKACSHQVRLCVYAGCAVRIMIAGIATTPHELPHRTEHTPASAPHIHITHKRTWREQAFSQQE